MNIRMLGASLETSFLVNPYGVPEPWRWQGMEINVERNKKMHAWLSGCFEDYVKRIDDDDNNGVDTLRSWGKQQ